MNLYPIYCPDCGAASGAACMEGCPNLDTYDEWVEDWDFYDQFDYEDNHLAWSEEEEWEYYVAQHEQHTCVIQETPDGMGCVTCLYS